MLGSLLCNVMCNVVFVFPVPEGGTIVGFVDDLTVVVTVFMDEKMETVLIINRRKRDTGNVEVGGTSVPQDYN